jgi:hypothetical protein
VTRGKPAVVAAASATVAPTVARAGYGRWATPHQSALRLVDGCVSTVLARRLASPRCRLSLTVSVRPSLSHAQLLAPAYIPSACHRRLPPSLRRPVVTAAPALERNIFVHSSVCQRQVARPPARSAAPLDRSPTRATVTGRDASGLSSNRTVPVRLWQSRATDRHVTRAAGASGDAKPNCSACSTCRATKHEEGRRALHRNRLPVGCESDDAIGACCVRRDTERSVAEGCLQPNNVNCCSNL